MMLRTVIAICTTIACIIAVCCTLILVDSNDKIIKYNAKLLSAFAKSSKTISNQALTLRSQSRQFDILNDEKQGILNRARDMKVELFDLRNAIKFTNKNVAYLLEQVITYERKIKELEAGLEE